MSEESLRRFPLSEPDGLIFDPVLDDIRANEPLCRVKLPYGGNAWLLTRLPDARTVLSDQRFSRAETVVRDTPRTRPERVPAGLMDLDPPEHTRVRGVIGKAFTVRRVDQLRPRAAGIADDLLTAIAAAGPPVDLVEAFAVPFPTMVICELMGIPFTDLDRFRRWTDAFMSTSALTLEERGARLAELAQYLKDQIAQRQAEPADDLLGALVVARDDQGRLSEQEVIELATVLLAAGHESTSSQIGNFAYTLMTHPDQLARLREHPELVPGAVEELVRFVPLSTTEAELPRFATEDVELSGGTVAAGEAVMLSLNAANRDPSAFPDPGRLDITRDTSMHVGFGYGVHHCIGAQLARMELQVALDGLLTHLPGLRLATDDEHMRWKKGLATRGPLELPVTW